jgi:hypothetical protein
VRNKIPKPPNLSASAQSIALRQCFPSGQTAWNRCEVRWTGEISPSEFSRTYVVELNYNVGDPPRVWVRQPDLKRLADGRKLPHMYDQETQRLCLYFPNIGLWRPNMALACTVLPWTCLWLYTFEIWLVTDVWHTRGVHPDGLKIG